MAVIYLCPADKRLSCSWEGPASEIKQHFENEHNQLVCHTNCVEIDLQKLPENKLLCLDNKVYLVQNYVDGSRLVIKLRYLGSNKAAAKIQYDITISVNKVSYRYDPTRYFSCVVPTGAGWEVNLEYLEKFHGKLEIISCTVLLNYTIEKERKISTIDIERKISDASLNINNQYIEKNVCDETEQNKKDESPYFISEQNIMDDLKFLNDKIADLKLRKQHRESGDFMDRISHLNFSILEEPFNKNEELKESPDRLPDNPEEVNLSCTACNLDMLPPIYLCVNGHNVCYSCRNNPCKICDSTITETRNIDLENISRTQLHHCRYSSEGCNERLMYNELRGHEAKCQFCKYKCMSDCIFQGKFDQFNNHLKIVHSSVKLTFSLRNEFPKNTELYVANKSVGIFYCKSEFDKESITWKAVFCGPTERRFFCELSFKGSKYKEPIFLKREGNVYEIKKPVAELKKYKAKEKYAVLTITSYDS